MIPESLYRWTQLKGIAVVGTGDVTHPAWFAELQDKLEPAEPGLYRLKPELAAPVDREIPESCRAELLADQPTGHRPPNALPFWSLVPLVEILSEIKGAGVTTKGVTGVYHRVLADLGNEFSILVDVPIVDIEEHSGTL